MQLFTPFDDIAKESAIEVIIVTTVAVDLKLALPIKLEDSLVSRVCDFRFALVNHCPFLDLLLDLLPERHL